MAARCRSFLPWLAASAAAAGLAACGGSGGTPVGNAAVAQAAVVTAHQGTAQIRMSGTMHLAGRDFGISGDGVLSTDPKRHLGRLTFTMDVTGKRYTIQELFFKRAMYVGGPMLAGKIPDGKHWIRVDVFGLLKSEGLDLGKLDNGADSATQGLSYLRQAGSVTRLGTETVNGVRTTHYHALVDMDKAFDRLGATKLKKVYDKQVGAGTKVPTDVWVDAERRIRRYRLTTPTQFGTGDVTIDFVRFGVVLTSQQEPAASDSYDGTELVRKQLAAQGG